MKKLLALLLFAGFASALAFLGGCNALSDAQKAESVINTILNIAQAEEPVLPSADSAVLAPWVNLGINLNGQLETCITAAGTKASKLTTCFNTFASGLLSTTELAQLRLLSPASQSKAQLWVTAILIGVNVVTAVATPQIGQQPTSREELEHLAYQVGDPDWVLYVSQGR